MSLDNSELKEIKTTAYPNPSSDGVTINLVKDRDYTFNLYNNLGQAIILNHEIKNNTYTFSVSDLNNGIYHYRITDKENKFSSGKLIVQH